MKKTLLTVFILSLSMLSMAQLPPALRKKVDKYFTKEVDKFNGSTYYSSKLKGFSVLKPWFHVIITPQGEWQLGANVVNPSWIFATELRCKVDDRYYSFKPDYDKIDRRAGYGSVTETFTIAPPNDQNLLHAIYHSTNRPMFRATGSDGLVDFEPNDNQLQMLKTAYELITALKGNK
jgi:hypothetical protein